MFRSGHFVTRFVGQRFQAATAVVVVRTGITVMLLAAAWALALCLLGNFQVAGAMAALLPLAPLTVLLPAATWLLARGHRRVWRYASLEDLLHLALTAQLSLALALAAYLLWRWLAVQQRLPMPPAVPLAAFPLDCLLCIALQAATQVAVRLAFEHQRPASPSGLVRLLIVGAGDAGDRLLREIQRMPQRRYTVVGLVDDAPQKQRQQLHGSDVLGRIDQLPAICRRHRVAEILIAIPSASRQEMQRIISHCHRAQGNGPDAMPLRFRTVPGAGDFVSGMPAIQQVRDVNCTDLLGRQPVQMDFQAVQKLIAGTTVLVTGAGGSIGSELCRLIARVRPQRLVLMDKAENAIFEIERELKRSYPHLPVTPCIGDISDAARLRQIFTEASPALVFHAAAHKHVPLAEQNPGEAIRNNVVGTRRLAEAAIAAGVRHFVMISTDKAVNPSSIMGATKRCAEIVIQSLSQRSTTNFITVRFGNVLNSNGSVVPIFMQQIAAGGPVTVTHPEMRRYFMTIPEAAELVLQAAALGRRGEIFVLDMGSPVRIMDLARDLILLCGLRPEIDIPIVCTGLRPGEKLFEELSIHGEDMLPTRHEKISIWKSRPQPWSAVLAMLQQLEPLQRCDDRRIVLDALTAAVPEMVPWEDSLASPTSHRRCLDATPAPHNITGSLPAQHAVP